MKKFSIIFSLTSLMFFSCNNNSNEKPIEINQSTSIKIDSIELNNGEKWNVDSNMIIHIRNMENEVYVFSKSNTRDYTSLSKKLQTNIDILTSNCTMKGQAHDELHKWLLPYIDLVTELSEAKENTIAQKSFQEIKNSFIIFNQYFK